MPEILLGVNIVSTVNRVVQLPFWRYFDPNVLIVNDFGQLAWKSVKGLTIVTKHALWI